jgi:hypothetical protein
MRLIGTAIAAAAALTLVTAGVANARHHHHHGGTYKFTVECPVLSPMPWTKGTCSARGANREDARATCQTQNQLCYIRHVGRKHKK